MSKYPLMFRINFLKHIRKKRKTSKKFSQVYFADICCVTLKKIPLIYVSKLRGIFFYSP